MRIFAIFVALMFLLIACAPADEPQDVPQQSVADDVPQTQEAPPVVTEQQTTPVTDEQVIRGTRNFLMTVDRTGFTPGVLTVPHEYRIKITITNEDSEEHSFDLVEYGVSENIPAKRTAVIEFVADTRGEFTFDDRFGRSGTIIVGGKT